ncbi:MAG: hypothetical protein DWQ10_14790 [Calditrichaeota bacterium]|nr:MAG: hypothetical protein DWQ10_14790 [Calditrichota bacterium]
MTIGFCISRSFRFFYMNQILRFLLNFPPSRITSSLQLEIQYFFNIINIRLILSIDRSLYFTIFEDNQNKMFSMGIGYNIFYTNQQTNTTSHPNEKVFGITVDAEPISET